MENTLRNNSETPKRLAELIKNGTSPELASLEGVFCGVSVFWGETKPVVNPTSGETVDYSRSVILSTDDAYTYGGSLSNSLKKLSILTERETGLKRLSFFRKLGVRVLLPVYDASDSMVGVDNERCWPLRRKIEEELEMANRLAIEGRGLGHAIEGTLFAPDSYAYDHDCTNQAANLYFIGDVAVDQRERAKNFWDAVDGLAERYQLPDLQNHQGVGIVPLIIDILKKSEQKQLSKSEKDELAYSIIFFVIARNSSVIGMDKLRRKYIDEHSRLQQLELRKELGINLSSEKRQNESGAISENINEIIQLIDQVVIDSIEEVFSTVKAVHNQADEREIKNKLEEMYQIKEEKHLLQDMLLRQLSYAAREATVDYMDDALCDPVRFITKLPAIGVDLDNLSKNDVKELYAAFCECCAKNDLSEMRSPEEFMKIWREVEDSNKKPKSTARRRPLRLRTQGKRIPRRLRQNVDRRRNL